MKLFGSYTSPFVRHCRIALLESQIPFDFIETDYDQSSAGSPAQRVPYLQAGELKLHDSASILRYIREQSGAEFFPDIVSYDLFCLINTALDSTVNVFLLERHGVNVPDNAYLQRQQARVQSCLEVLDEQCSKGMNWDDAGIRLACLLDWAEFRQRLSFQDFSGLQSWLKACRDIPDFSSTSPFTA